MKKVINGKLYNTDTAGEIFCHPYGDDTFSKLYKKKNGEFFLHIGGNYIGQAEKIEPVELTEAKIFVAAYGTGDEYENIFGKVEE